MLGQAPSAAPSRRHALPWELRDWFSGRWQIPLIAIGVYASFMWLWAGGHHGIYFAILDFLGIEPYSVPFLDTHAILSAAECHHRGIDVFLQNPCDILQRTHNYSPLWLSLIPASLGTQNTEAVGIALDLMFVLSLTILFRPRSSEEYVVFLFGVLSPAVIFAVERANNDLVVFLLLLISSAISISPKLKMLGYSPIVIAGLLKYYPLSLLILLFRESRSVVTRVVAGVTITAAIFAVVYGTAIGKALANIPRVSYFGAAFSAKNLPFGIATSVVPLPSLTGTALAVFILGLLLLLFGRSAWRSGRVLARHDLAWNDADLRMLVIASLIVPACFFAGQNIIYRGIFLLFGLPGLLRLQSSTELQAERRWISRIILACLFVLWYQFGHQVLLKILPLIGNSSIEVGIWIVAWIIRELIWWWLIASLSAIAGAYLYHTASSSGWLRALRSWSTIPHNFSPSA